NCGTLQGRMPLHVRTWTCDCGAVHDRDVNAAKNLLAAGLAVSACGAGVRPQRSTWSDCTRDADVTEGRGARGRCSP
ncbi:zinc ribbon domain-containing protein, partial [Streptomyces sp. DSM 41972]|nr:zinc ribbon domain-containing protein [Streptomyces sp. DSM 41972]